MIDASGQGGGWLSDTEQQHWLACGAGPPGGGQGLTGTPQTGQPEEEHYSKGGVRKQFPNKLPSEPPAAATRAYLQSQSKKRLS